MEPVGPTAEPSGGRRTGLIVGLGVAILVVAAIVVFYLVRQGDETVSSTTTVPASSAPGTGIPPPAEEPAGLGDVAELDGLAQSCYDGDMTACDSLFDTSAVGSAYERYGDTCAGRQAAGTNVYCVDAFPPG